ncbi:Bax inhibitor-1/YccA family protein [Leminorella grimontii]|uniref:Bax inhibitor-1/YccA family protein n=1 Tax=Leminorella grimontii TaxID=82981 RepID=UPI00321F7331
MDPRYNGTITQRAEGGLQAFMAQVYGWMTCGLLLTGVTAWMVPGTALQAFIFSSNITFYGLIIVQLGVVFFLSGMVSRISGAMATTLFMLYSVLTGLTLSSVFIVYTSASIASTFFITAGTFGAMSVYGYTTKRDLTKLGSLMVMGLIGILLASIVNIFLKSAPLYWAITYIGVIVFVGLTAYDTQKLKAIGESASMDDRESYRKNSIMGALTLYLDFINLFLMLLRILGDRR